jgi:twitching motility protein PilT
MLGTPAVRNLIRDSKTYQLHNVMQLGRKEGMQTLDQCLADMVKKRIVARDKAMAESSDPDQVAKLLKIPAGVAIDAQY